MKWINLLFIFFVSILIYDDCSAQQSIIQQNFTLLENRLESSSTFQIQQEDTTDRSREFPKPKSVLFKSLIIPGWGQIVNRQIWKVPIIYGMFAGVGYYTIYLNDQYKDYRAAYYNATQGEDNDFRFGPTPAYLQGINESQLQSNRNSFRNRRDFMFVVMGLAYGLNALDAYIFAHMRSFDVSDNLSAKTTIGPTILAEGKPGIQVTFSLSK